MGVFLLEEGLLVAFAEEVVEHAVGLTLGAAHEAVVVGLHFHVGAGDCFRDVTQSDDGLGALPQLLEEPQGDILLGAGGRGHLLEDGRLILTLLSLLPFAQFL